MCCNLVSWSKKWQMLFNVEKCKVMHIEGRVFHGWSPTEYRTKRNVVDRSKETVLPLYKSLVRPHLGIKLLEGVQPRATKLIKGIDNYHYEVYLRQLGLMSLETRRVKGDLIEVYKFLNGGYTIDSDIYTVSRKKWTPK